MVERHESDKTKEENREDALVGYQMAINLWTYSVEQSWERFNIMLVANSVLIAAIGLTTTSQRPVPLLSHFSPWLGLVLCILWFLLVRRTLESAEYYILSARELEERYLSPSVVTISRGAIFADGKPVDFELQGIKVSKRLGKFARWLRAKEVSYIGILLFVVFYLAAIFVYPL